MLLTLFAEEGGGKSGAKEAVSSGEKSEYKISKSTALASLLTYNA